MTDSTIPVKRCNKCRQEKPATPEYFTRDRSGKNGLRSQCKICASLHMKEQRKQNPERFREYDRKRNPDKVRASLRKSRQRHGEKQRAESRKRYAENRQYRQQLIEYQKEYRRKNAARLKKYRDTRYANGYRASKTTRTTADLRRMAREKSLPVAFNKTHWQHCQDYFGHRCAACGRPRGLWHTLAADHWIALTDPRPDNPGTVPWNIVPLCHGDGGCNNSKHAREATEWLIERYGKDRAREILERINAYFEMVKSQ